MTETFFEDRNGPPRPGAGHEVPVGVREALLSWLQGRGLRPVRIGMLLLAKRGNANWKDLADELEGQYGWSSALTLRNAIGRAQVSYRPEVQAGITAQAGLTAIPDDLFLTSLEIVAQEWHGGRLRDLTASTQVSGLVTEVNRIFALRGVEFRMSDDGWIDWHGDHGAHGLVVAPALAALDDPRLLGARSEFEAALAHLRGGTDKEREDAIEEAAKSVESTMRTVLAEHNVTVRSNATAQPLFDALKSSKLVEPYTEYSILGAARIRNKLGGHGSGAAPRTIDQAYAELCVRASASAIVFLRTLLP